MKQNGKRFLSAAFVLLLYVCGAICFEVSRVETEALIRRGGLSRVEQLSKQRVKTVGEMLEGRFSVLETLALVLEDADGMQSERFGSLMARVAQDNDFSFVGYMDVNGRYRTGEDAPLEMTPAQKARSQALVFSTDRAFVSLAGETRWFLLTTPVKQGGSVVGAVYAGVDSAAFATFLDEAAPGDESYAFIADSKGDILVHSDSPSYIYFTDNTLEFYKEAALMEGASVEGVAADLQSGAGGALSYSYGNQFRYASYEKMDYNDWFLFSVMPSAKTQAGVAAVHTQLRRLAFAIAGLGLLLVGIFCYQYHLLRKRQLHQASLRACEQALRKAAETLSGDILFEVDPATGDVSYNDRFKAVLGRAPGIHNVDELLGDTYPLYGEDAGLWEKLVREMRRGVPSGKVNVRLRHADKTLNEYRVTYICVYDEDKTTPYGIVGKIERI